MLQNQVPAVLLIYTGGTIGMIENPETGALDGAIPVGQIGTYHQ